MALMNAAQSNVDAVDRSPTPPSSPPPPMSLISGSRNDLVNCVTTAGERGADHDADREVDDVAAHDEVFEALEHRLDLMPC